MVPTNSVDHQSSQTGADMHLSTRWSYCLKSPSKDSNIYIMNAVLTSVCITVTACRNWLLPIYILLKNKQQQELEARLASGHCPKACIMLDARQTNLVRGHKMIFSARKGQSSSPFQYSIPVVHSRDYRQPIMVLSYNLWLHCTHVVCDL